MVFTSFSFIAFFLLFCVAYFATSGMSRLSVCLLGSYIFYGWWDWRFLGLILLSTVIDYVVGWQLERTVALDMRKRWVSLSVIANLAILGVFKYFNFFADGFVHVARAMGFSVGPLELQIILPVGISFYTFQSMSYTIDVYRRRIVAEPSFLRFATYVAFFPQLVAGPIIRARDFLPQLRLDYSFCWDRLARGMVLICWGYVLKLVVADSLAYIVDLRFANPTLHNSASLTIGVLFYAFQIYCDFNGYSLIAIGLACILGIDIGMNFDRPYFASSFSDFWQRWHISLSSWLRDYLYIPLGGSRCSRVRTFINLMLTMLLGGLWHGASLRFVAWGGLHGTYLVAQRLFELVRERFFPYARRVIWWQQAICILVVFFATCVAWVFFRAPSFDDALTIFRRVFVDRDFRLNRVPQAFYVVKGIVLIGVVYGLEWLSFRISAEDIFARYPWTRPVALASILWAVALLGTFGHQTFIYFQF